jgi:hypothetical protein
VPRKAKPKIAKLAIDAQANGKLRSIGQVKVFAEDGAVLATDEGNLMSAPGRQKLIESLRKQLGASAKDVSTLLEPAWKETVAKHEAQQATESDGEKDNNKEERGKLSQADKLVALTHGLELFHTPGGYDSEGYATVTVADHRETWPIRSNGFRRWLAKRYYDTFAKTPGSQAIQDAINVLAGKAVHEGAEHQVAVRLAEQDGAIWLDLGDAQWRAVRITGQGWAIVRDCPIKFVRRRGMLALPEPVVGGTVDELRQFINVADGETWVLVVACLLAMMRPGRPFPVLAVSGEQGSAKSTLCKMLRALIDPNQAPLRRPPREARDLMIAACNSWIVAFDNLSGLPAELSDALCCLATGGGFGTRELFSDDEEKLFSATRPVILNGIEDVTARPDLLDRAVLVMLLRIEDNARRDEEHLWRDFEEARPRVLGALLSVVSKAICKLPAVTLTNKPRMADFALWVTAAEPALGWKPGTFAAAYEANRNSGATAALESAILAPVLFAVLEDTPSWNGTARQLLEQLDFKADDKARRQKEWPTSPRKLAGDLRRLAPSLRVAGVKVEFDRAPDKRRRRLITLERTSKESSEPSEPSAAAETGRATSDGMPDGIVRTTTPYRPTVTQDVTWASDASDGSDGVLPDCSEHDQEESAEGSWGDACEYPPTT